ncbi:MAG: hypothetical protein M3517_12070, partial [Actinomycetota bacterium]|nr:hypothetical protein [Actinomycetota bacterium]
MLTAVVAAAAGFAVLVASKQALLDRDVDERHFFIQVAVFVVAGLGWALAHPGPQRALRAGLGAVAGAIAGVAGTFALGSTDQHIEAYRDEVVSGSTAGRALLWAAVTAAAWAVTIMAGTPREQMARTATGAAFGGAATGAAMGVLAGTTQFGSDNSATDLWFSLPFADAGAAVRALPLLLVACLVPLVLAATAGRAASFAPILSTGIAAALLLPALGGL